MLSQPVVEVRRLSRRLQHVPIPSQLAARERLLPGVCDGGTVRSPVADGVDDDEAAAESLENVAVRHHLPPVALHLRRVGLVPRRHPRELDLGVDLIDLVPEVRGKVEPVLLEFADTDVSTRIRLGEPPRDGVFEGTPELHPRHIGIVFVALDWVLEDPRLLADVVDDVAYVDAGRSMEGRQKIRDLRCDEGDFAHDIEEW